LNSCHDVLARNSPTLLPPSFYSRSVGRGEMLRPKLCLLAMLLGLVSASKRGRSRRRDSAAYSGPAGELAVSAVVSYRGKWIKLDLGRGKLSLGLVYEDGYTDYNSNCLLLSFMFMCSDGPHQFRIKDCLLAGCPEERCRPLGGHQFGSQELSIPGEYIEGLPPSLFGRWPLVSFDGFAVIFFIISLLSRQEN